MEMSFWAALIISNIYFANIYEGVGLKMLAGWVWLLTAFVISFGL